jgi:hypothetical protein
MKHNQLTPEFVEVMPDTLQDGVLYISMVYALAAHRCACGCGEEVITPFSPTDWHLAFDGEHVSLKPSIGNWNFACRSHYWIKGNRIRWAGNMSEARIDEGRSQDRIAKASYYGVGATASTYSSRVACVEESSAPESSTGKGGVWKRLKKRWDR